MAVGIHRYDFLWIAPLWEGADLCCRLSVGEVRLVSDVKILACYSQRVIDGVRAAMGTNS